MFLAMNVDTDQHRSVPGGSQDEIPSDSLAKESPFAA